MISSRNLALSDLSLTLNSFLFPPSTLGARDRLCHESLEGFFADNLYDVSTGVTLGGKTHTRIVLRLYGNASFLAQWTNPHTSTLKRSGITSSSLSSSTCRTRSPVGFPGNYPEGLRCHVRGIRGPSVMDRCCDSPESADQGNMRAASRLVGVRALISMAEKCWRPRKWSQGLVRSAERMQAVHAEMRRKAWVALPVFFG